MNHQLGTFPGVFTPSILTILGLILFLRLGYVVGNAGLGQALLIILLANTISILTTFSLSAIATNFRVRGGGDYYLISRTIGLEYGGAIGVVLFLAQSISIGFYCLGFGEVFSSIFNLSADFWTQLIAISAVAVLFIFAWLGADWATRFQYAVMTILFLALISFFLGGFSRWNPDLFQHNWLPNPESPDFWVLFAIFFPAVTGFTQGVSMSGDLRDPGRSLPLGTFSAVFLSIAVYIGVAIVLAFSLPRNLLVNDYASMKRVALYGYMVNAGVIAATLSSAMASFLGSARILQSLARDRVFPFLSKFAQGVGPSDNPRKAVLLAMGIAILTIEIGNLNLVAPVVTMFFLVSYGLLNYATYYEAQAASPSFRPRFRWYSSKLSLLGALACIVGILAIDWKAGGIAIFILWVLHQYLYKTSGPSRWADSRRSHYLRILRDSLFHLAEDPEHPRDWRPQLLVLSADPDKRNSLISFCHWIIGNIGLLTIVHIVQGKGEKDVKKKEEVEKLISREIKENNWSAFPLGLTVSNWNTGFDILLQSFGVGPLHANTVVLDYREIFENNFTRQKINPYRTIRTALRCKYNVILLHHYLKGWKRLFSLPPRQRRIDIWCQGESYDQLMMLFAYLMIQTPFWRHAGIRVIRSAEAHEVEQIRTALHNQLEEFRIEAEAVVIPEATEKDLIKETQDAALVILPFSLRGEILTHPLGGDAVKLSERLPVTALIAAGQEIDFEAEPDEGIAAEIALAHDLVEKAEVELTDLEKEADLATENAQIALKKLIEARSGGLAKEDLEDLDKEAHEARAKMVELSRKVGKAEYHLERMKKELNNLKQRYPNLVDSEGD